MSTLTKKQKKVLSWIQNLQKKEETKEEYVTRRSMEILQELVEGIGTATEAILGQKALYIGWTNGSNYFTAWIPYQLISNTFMLYPHIAKAVEKQLDQFKRGVSLQRTTRLGRKPKNLSMD